MSKVTYKNIARATAVTNPMPALTMHQVEASGTKASPALSLSFCTFMYVYFLVAPGSWADMVATGDGLPTLAMGDCGPARRAPMGGDGSPWNGPGPLGKA